MLLTDYRTKHQVDLDALKKLSKEQGLSYSVVRYQGFISHAEVEIKDSGGQPYLGFGSSQNRMKALLLAEIDAVRKLLEFSGVETQFSDGKEPIEELPNDVVVKIDRESIIKCKTVTDIYLLIKQDKELTDKLTKYQKDLIQDGKRLNSNKAAEYLFPRRKAVRIAPIEAKTDILDRNINQMLEVESKLNGVGIKAANYLLKVDSLVSEKYPNFELFCKKATENEITHLVSAFGNFGISNG